MNIAYLIGNGFDLNLGLNTRYSDFYEYYKNIHSDNTLIKSLKEELNNNYDKWSDLESALGEHTRNLSQTSELFEMLDDIRINIATYIREEEDKFTIKNIDITTLSRYIAFPDDYLSNADKERIEEFISAQDNTAFNIDIISFNYSKILNKLIEKLSVSSSMGVRNKLGESRKVSFISNIYHVHGDTEKNMVLGVNDVSQIANEEFREHKYVLNALVKPECNIGYGHLIDKKCKSIIEEANIICLFGLSLGDTDRIWWENIGEQLRHRSDCIVLIFSGNKNIDFGINTGIQNYKVAEKNDEIREFFMKQAGLDSLDTNIEERIFVGFNTRMFQLQLEQN